jgi:hypothetical protein
MRILHIDTGRELRGGQRQLLLLARGLGVRGHSQTVLARAGSPLFKASREAGITTMPATAANLLRQAPHAEVIHAHDARGHTLAVLAGGNTPVIVSRRVAFPVGSGVLSRWKYSRAARFLAVSRSVAGQLAAAGVSQEKIAVVYDGVELKERATASGRERLVLAPATDDPQKGSALAREACRAAGVELKFSCDLEEDLPRAALFLYLTRSEGLGSAILLAMACGAPVVASNVGGIPEVIEHGVTGLLVENAPEAVVAAIQSVMSDLASAARCVEAAREQVAARFSSDIMVAQTERAYEMVVTGRPSA